MKCPECQTEMNHIFGDGISFDYKWQCDACNLIHFENNNMTHYYNENKTVQNGVLIGGEEYELRKKIKKLEQQIEELKKARKQ